jgi:hypothetical protein
MLLSSRLDVPLSLTAGRASLPRRVLCHSVRGVLLLLIDSGISPMRRFDIEVRQTGLPRGRRMLGGVIVLRLAWLLLIGIPVALVPYTLSSLFFVTVIGIPFAIVLAVLATKALSAPF